MKWQGIDESRTKECCGGMGGADGVETVRETFRLRFEGMVDVVR